MDMKEDFILRINDTSTQIKYCLVSDKVVVIEQPYDKRIIYDSFYTFDGTPLEASTEASLRHTIAEFIIQSIVDEEKIIEMKHTRKQISESEKECLSIYDAFDPEIITYDSFILAISALIESGMAYKHRADNLLKGLDLLDQAEITEEELPYALYGLFGHHILISDKSLRKLESIIKNAEINSEEQRVAIRKLCGLKGKV